MVRLRLHDSTYRSDIYAPQLPSPPTPSPHSHPLSPHQPPPATPHIHNVSRNPPLPPLHQQHQPPPTPTITARAIVNAVELQWGALAGSGRRYDLWSWWDKATGWVHIGGNNLTGTTFTHTGLSPTITYYYAVRGMGVDGNPTTVWSEYASACTDVWFNPDARGDPNTFPNLDTNPDLHRCCHSDTNIHRHIDSHTDANAHRYTRNRLRKGKP